MRGRLPTIPEYYADLIDNSVDLTAVPKQCCPFHKEDTPSFSYSPAKGVWRCFGGCHCGGDVIDLHRKNYHLRTREEAKKSLNKLYGIVERVEVPKYAEHDYYVNDTRVFDNATYITVRKKANTVERWLELDYVMSQTPVETYALDELIHEWDGVSKEVSQNDEEF